MKTHQTRTRRRQLLGWSALASVTAGTLRIAASFWPSDVPGVGLELLYLLIDLLILFGILGLYGFQSERIRPPGVPGFILAVTGTAIITGPDGRIATVDMYATGSLLLGIGLVLLGVGSWRARTLPRWVVVLWMASTAIGIAGAMAGLEVLFLIAGLMFGLAFVGAGARVWSASRGTAFDARAPGL